MPLFDFNEILNQALPRVQPETVRMVQDERTNKFVIEVVGQGFSPYGRLIEVLGNERVSRRWDRDQEKAYCTVARSTYDEALTILRMNYTRVIVSKIHNKLEKCNASCQNAEGEICECSCLHKNHGRKDPTYFMVDEKTEMLLKNNRVRVDVTYINDPTDAGLETKYKMLVQDREDKLEMMRKKNA